MDQNPQNLVSRPPVIVVMGHVDHGKTTLLDYIRKSRVANREAGGITQHLGAYEIEYKNKKITFLDTPGHEAFSKIRQRGSKVADLALLVIAADEGLKPQTLEALKYIKAENLPFIVVINKTDRPGANPDKVKQELAEQEVYIEEWGGKVPVALTSATSGQGVEELLELILLMAEMEELRADQAAPAQGVVLESSLDPRRGIMASLLIFNGTLKTGDTVYTATASAKVKLLQDFAGKRIANANFSAPCLVVGWDQQPLVGERFAAQKELVQETRPAPQPALASSTPTTESQEAQGKTLNLILKADVAGSLEALETVTTQMLNDLQVSYEIVAKSVGEIVLSDLKLAETTRATIIAFNSKLTAETKNYYKAERIKIIQGNIIYHLLEELKAYLEKIANPNAENIVARLTVLELFSEKDKKNRQLVGGQLFEGKVKAGMKFNILHAEEKVGTGKILSIRKGKQELETAEAPVEIGLHAEYAQAETSVQKGDSLEFKEK